ncbi:MAG: hypothetical protein H6757_03275 [Candidatus Omnitrophica bacterium]|nr:hypothetical protein [Candidatus Omnitrophota bacterium]
MKNWRVYLLAFIFILTGLVIFFFKMSKWDKDFRPGQGGALWDVVIQMNYKGRGEASRIRLTLPSTNERQIIYHEDFDNDLDFSTHNHQRTNNRIGYWNSDLLDKSGSVRYSFSVQVRSQQFEIPQEARISTHPENDYPDDIQFWLRSTKHIQSDNPSIYKHLKKIIRKKDKKAAVVTEKIFKYIRGEIKYQSEKGSKDATQTLDALTADCGGQARLFVAFSRAAGIPSRLVGGILLDEGVKTVTHVWAENYIGGTWIPFDVVNNHFAFLPANYLEMYRGDYALIRHMRLESFEYFFVIEHGKIPPADPFFTLYSLPLPFQNSVKVLLLIPIGVLVVTIFRVLIGVPTFGTFAPIILALAFREISLGTGLACLSLMIGIGCVLRIFLDWLKVLVVPRISLIITTVVIMTVGIMVFGNLIGQGQLLYISLFPMIIITWTIERFSVVQTEDGTVAALKIAAGTTLVAMTAYFLMDHPALRFYLFTYPELLLGVMGLLLLLGRYTGLRLSELWRFRELRKIKG